MMIGNKFYRTYTLRKDQMEVLLQIEVETKDLANRSKWQASRMAKKNKTLKDSITNSYNKIKQDNKLVLLLKEQALLIHKKAVSLEVAAIL